VSELDRRWERLARAARRAPARPARSGGLPWVERVARQGLQARSAPPSGRHEPLAWAGLAALVAPAAALVLLFPAPLATVSRLARERVVALPRSLPPAPRLPRPPAAPRLALPGADSTLAALRRWPELTLDLPFTSSGKETP